MSGPIPTRPETPQPIVHEVRRLFGRALAYAAAAILVALAATSLSTPAPPQVQALIAAAAADLVQPEVSRVAGLPDA